MAKKIITVKLDSLTLDPNNARKHGETDIEAIAKSLDQFAQQSPIVITADNLVIKGNGTVMAAMKLGWKTIEAIRTELTGQELKAYGVADNQTGLLSSWDNDKLLELLQGFDDELLASTGFDDDAIAELLQEVHPSFEPSDPITLNEMSPKMVTCPRCNQEFDLRASK
jgi:ParB-like chromosome segregation protein Spo0J